MQYFYSGQVRKYVTQIVRLLSEFSVKQNDGTLIRIPVTYGDMDRQVANIINQNSENTALSAPKISVYITGLSFDRDRLGDSTHIGKIFLRERAVTDGVYTSDQGSNYTVERLMPSPYKLTVKVDIWASSADQKLQILEQILMFFNPSLEIQTSDNFVDWTSLTVVDLDDITYTSRQVPAGTQVTIDVATMTLSTPIWISPPVKVKKMGVITSVFGNIMDQIDPRGDSYYDGLGHTLGDLEPSPFNRIANYAETIGNYDILVTGKNILAYSSNQPQSYVSWYHITEQIPGKYQEGLAKIYLIQPDGTEVLGFGTINIMDETLMVITDWDPDTYPANTPIPGPTRLNTSWGNFDAVIDPIKTRPQNVLPGTRFLLIEGIGGGVHDTFVVENDPLNRLEIKTPFTKVNFYTFKVDGVEVDSIPMPNVVYQNMNAMNISSNGSSASFDVHLIVATAQYGCILVNPGTDYNVGDKIKVRGNLLGGAIVENDCVIIVGGIDMNGGITDFRVIGSSIPYNFTIIPTVPVPVGSTVSYELFVNADGPDAWKNADGSDFIANMNDIIEWDGLKWNRVFDSIEVKDLVYQTNLHTLAQYKWTNGEWLRSFEGIYKRGMWRIVL